MKPDQIEIAVESSQGAAAIGRVIAVGDQAGALADKRVLVGGFDPCGECDICRRGGAAVCPLGVRRGDAGDRVIAAARWAVILDEGLTLPPAGAAVAGDVALAYTLYARTGIGPREPVAITGASSVARFLVEILRAKGIVPVVLVDPVDPANTANTTWCEWLVARGALIAADREAVTAAFAADGVAGRTWRVIATDPGTVAAAAALAGPRSTLTVLAPVADLPGDLIAREVTVIGVAGAHPDLFVEVAAMVIKGEVQL